MVRLTGLVLLLSLGACGGDSSGSSSLNTSCTADPFSVLPVDPSAIDHLTPTGDMAPPTHTIPTDHVGFYLTANTTTLYAPGRIRVDTIEKDTCLVSDFRQGQSDDAVICQRSLLFSAC